METTSVGEATLKMQLVKQQATQNLKALRAEPYLSGATENENLQIRLMALNSTRTD